MVSVLAAGGCGACGPGFASPLDAMRGKCGIGGVSGKIKAMLLSINPVLREGSQPALGKPSLCVWPVPRPNIDRRIRTNLFRCYGGSGRVTVQQWHPWLLKAEADMGTNA